MFERFRGWLRGKTDTPVENSWPAPPPNALPDPAPAPVPVEPATPPEKAKPSPQWSVLDHFGLVAHVSPEVVVNHWVEIAQPLEPKHKIQTRVRTFDSPIDALKALLPFTNTLANRFLFFEGRNGTYCVVENSLHAPNAATVGKLRGFDGFVANYQVRPWWCYHVAVHTTGGLDRHLVSTFQKDANFFETPDPMEFEDPAALKRLRKTTPIGRGEIAKFCQMFGWPLPMSKEGLEFITKSILFETTSVRSRQAADPELAITLVPPSWLGEAVDLLTDPAPDPKVVQREAVRKKWAKFRRAFQSALKEKFGTVRHVLVLPADGIVRHASGSEPWIELIAPDDAVLLKGLEDRMIDDAMAAGAFFANADVLGIDGNHDVFAVIEPGAKAADEKGDWRITFAPDAQIPAWAYSTDESGARRERIDVRREYAG